MRYLLLGLIRCYQYLLSPIMAGRCRFYPSCSQYSYESIRHYGVYTGCKLALKRLFKCHPWHAGGYDPIPDNHG